MRELYGDPFDGEDLERLRAFLQLQGLVYDEGIRHTLVLEDEGRIVATGSCQGNVVKCVAVAPDYQGQNLLGRVMTHLVSWLMERGVTRYFGFTKPQNKGIFKSLGLHPVEETDSVLLLESRKGGLEKYLARLGRETEQQMAAGCENGSGYGIGAVVANCNPFTLGHEHLVRSAAAACRWLHLFVLSEEQPFMPSAERMRLVREGVGGLRNVIVHEAGDYVVSPATFPTYFFKDKAHAYEANCQLDVKLFAGKVAPALGVTRRFVGTEPNCPITAQYNDCLKRGLPAYGIELVEVPRLCLPSGAVVSASTVRSLVSEGRYDEVIAFVPPTTLEYLLHRCR